MTSSESLRGVRPEGQRATASDGARKPRADRIEIDFDWSDHGAPEPSSHRRTRRSETRRAARHEERSAPSPAPISADPPVSEPVPTPTVDDVVAHTMSVTPSVMLAGEAAGVLGAPEQTMPARRTVVIRGQGARGYAPSRGGYEARLRPHERSGFKPDRVALWAVLLGLALLLGAVTSSHAATLHASALHVSALHVSALHQLLLHRALVHPAP